MIKGNMEIRGTQKKQKIGQSKQEARKDIYTKILPRLLTKVLKYQDHTNSFCSRIG